MTGSRIVLFIGGGLGDAMMSSPMMRALRMGQPNAFIVVAVKQLAVYNLLKDCDYFDDIIHLGSFDSWIEKRRYFASQKFDISIHNHSCQGTQYYSLPLFSGISKRVGFDRQLKKPGWRTRLKGTTLTNKTLYQPNQKRRTWMNLEVLSHIGIHAQDESYSLCLHSPERVKSRIGIHPGSDVGGEMKRWPLAYFLELSNRLIQDGYEIMVFLGPAERDMSSSWNEIAGVEVATTPGISELVDQIGSCSFFISNDSGLSHLAAGHHLPTCVIYGPTDKTEYTLPTEYYPIEPEQKRCSECLVKKECIHHNECLNSITVNRVYELIRKEFRIE